MENLLMIIAFGLFGMLLFLYSAYRKLKTAYRVKEKELEECERKLKKRQ